MRKRNWREYNKKLVQRGSLTFLIDPKIMKTLEVKAQKKRKGRPLRILRSADPTPVDGQNSLQNALPNVGRICSLLLRAVQKNEGSHLFTDV